MILDSGSDLFLNLPKVPEAVGDEVTMATRYLFFIVC